MIEQIKQALEEIDGTPWRVGTPSPNGLQNVGTKMGVMVCQTFNTQDAHLIANAPEWIRYLLGEVERLEGERDYFESVSNQHYDKWRKSVGEVKELQNEVERLQDEEGRIEFHMDADGNLRRKE